MIQKKMFLIFLFFGITFLFSSSVIHIANDAELNEHSPYITHYWYSGFLNWGYKGENYSPFWITYIEENDAVKRIVSKNIKFDPNAHGEISEISEKYIIKESDNELKKPLTENFLGKSVIIWEEKEDLFSNLCFSVFDGSQWSLPQNITNDDNKSNSLPVFITRDNDSDSLNQLIWICDNHIIKSSKLNSNLAWGNNDTILVSNNVITSIKEQYDGNQNLWLVYSEKFGNDSLMLKAIVKNYENNLWSDILTIAKIKTTNPYLDVTRNDELKYDFPMEINYLKEDSLFSNFAIYKNDSLKLYQNSQVSLLDENYTNIELSSNTWLVGGCIVSGLPYITATYKLNDKNYISFPASYYGLYFSNTCYSSFNSLSNICMSGFSYTGDYLIGWTEEANAQQDINVYSDYFPIGGIENQNLIAKLKLRNYPNPFNPTTTISYTLQEKSDVEVKIFDVSGKEVALIEKGMKNAGKHDVIFDGSKFSSGIYYYSLFLKGNNIVTQKMIMVK